LILVSIPNIQYYETFFLLLFGKFPRRERGIFDKTHLRWFTLREFNKIIENKFKILKMDRNYRIVEGEYFPKLLRFNNYFKLLFILFPPFFTFQYKFILQKEFK
jgi:hypothetical protein